MKRVGIITKGSSEMMRKSFENTFYKFMEKPEPRFDEDFGIYVHVPFCPTKCSFCPFYKELFAEELKEQYMEAICGEIEETDMEGQSRWVYFGGGSPNTLTIDELGRIVGCFESKVKIEEMGIELLPIFVSFEYLRGLKECGFTKISIGVESFSKEVICKTGRKTSTYEHLKQIIEFARSLGLWVNVDMMVGLPDQDSNIFRKDIQRIATIYPDQITIYPFMVIGRMKATPGIPADEQFQLIEEVGERLSKNGYGRKGVWTFTLGDDIYDSSRDELTEDYAGFGPSAFSTYGNWKVVNPEIEVYLKDFENGKKMGFVAKKSKASDEWRKFARMIYDLRYDNSFEFPFYIKSFISLMKLTGYIKGESLTEKGKIFAHKITKTVVESLPFPIQKPDCIENYNEYISYKNTILTSN